MCFTKYGAKNTNNSRRNKNNTSRCGPGWGKTSSPQFPLYGLKPGALCPRVWRLATVTIYLFPLSG